MGHFSKAAAPQCKSVYSFNVLIDGRLQFLENYIELFVFILHLHGLSVTIYTTALILSVP